MEIRVYRMFIVTVATIFQGLPVVGEKDISNKVNRLIRTSTN